MNVLTFDQLKIKHVQKDDELNELGYKTKNQKKYNLV